MSGRGGFTLVELLVALVLLEVGLLGVAGTVLLASRTLSQAEERERAVTRAALLLDSLERVDAVGAGRSAEPWGELRWSRDGDGRAVLQMVSGDGRSWVVEAASLLRGEGES